MILLSRARQQAVVRAPDHAGITATRTVHGDLGSSRQLQLGLKFIF